MNNHSQHTKRSPQFRLRLLSAVTRLDKLIAACQLPEGRPELGEFLHEVRTLLTVNTTDSPCVVKAEEGEPIFTLRGHDPCGPSGVNRWLEKSKRMGLHEEKRQDAEECRQEMIEWLKELQSVQEDQNVNKTS